MKWCADGASGISCIILDDDFRILSFPLGIPILLCHHFAHARDLSKCTHFGQTLLCGLQIHLGHVAMGNHPVFIRLKHGKPRFIQVCHEDFTSGQDGRDLDAPTVKLLFQCSGLRVNGSRQDALQ